MPRSAETQRRLLLRGILVGTISINSLGLRGPSARSARRRERFASLASAIRSCSAGGQTISRFSRAHAPFARSGRRFGRVEPGSPGYSTVQEVESFAEMAERLGQTSCLLAGSETTWTCRTFWSSGLIHGPSTDPPARCLVALLSFESLAGSRRTSSSSL
jgi:hypothetical protein